MDGSVPCDGFRGKYVLIGTTAASMGDRLTRNFCSGALVAARRFGHSRIGLEAEHTRGNGLLLSRTADADPGCMSQEQIRSASRVRQTRFAAGVARDMSKKATLGMFYRSAFLSATDFDTSHWIDGFVLGLNSTHTTGHFSEFGLRLPRGAYRPAEVRRDGSVAGGFAGGRAGAHQFGGLTRPRPRSSRIGGDRAGIRGEPAGGAVFDLAGGATSTEATRAENAAGAILQRGTNNGSFVSPHGAAQADLTRHLFVSASLLNVTRAEDLRLNLYPDQLGYTSYVAGSFFPLMPGVHPAGSRFSVCGVGWRFSPRMFLQYVYSTDYGVTAAAHMLMLRYTFRAGKE